MQNDLLAGILEKYDQTCKIHEEFTSKVKELIVTLLKSHSLRVHSITHRLKERESLKLKLQRPDSDYKELKDVADICGIRIITYFADEVDAVASMITDEFDIDYRDSVDKRALLDPDRFGYLSLHYVAKLNKSRLSLTEYKNFANCKVEIQIRSILQHTWAEIEHDLGYKSKILVPKEFQRRFFRLAGLLELADQEFSEIRNVLSQYESFASQKVLETPKALSIDKVSLQAYITNRNLVNEIDSKISKLCNIKLEGVDISPILIERLFWVGFKTIGDVDESLIRYQKSVVFFGKNIIGHYKQKKSGWSHGICLFYLCYVKISSENSFEQVYRFCEKIFENSAKKTTKNEKTEFARRLVTLYKESLKN